MIQPTRLALLAGALLGAQAAGAVDTAPLHQAAPEPTRSHVLIEAEAAPRGEVKKDAAASGGSYVSVEGDYQPVFAAPVPADGADELTVWVRHKGVPLQLKGVKAGKQFALRWAYPRPEAFTWTSLGRHRRSALGESIVIIRGKGGEGGVDAVVFAGDRAFDPVRDLPAAANPVVTASTPVQVRVDWDKIQFATNRMSFGLNGYAAFNPETAADPTYQANLRYLNPGLLRIHNGEQLGDASTRPMAWLDHNAKTWDKPKIKRALEGLAPLKIPTLITIVGWPPWMDKDGDKRLDPGEYERFAALCADLVRFVNGELKLKVPYWEITNEKDDHYWVGEVKSGKPDHLDDLVALYNHCAVAMKKADPTLQTGGPAVARGDLVEHHRRFVRGTKNNLDFFSFHIYATGSASDSDQKIYDRAVAMGDHVGAIVKMLKKESPQRHIPAHLNEHNISWTWRTRDKRMTNHKGAVWDALALMAAAQGGVVATNAWNDRDGVYGKTAPDGTRRPSAHLFHLLNQHLIGNIVAATSSDPKAVVVWAAKSGGERNAILIINRSDQVQPVVLTSTGGKLDGKTLNRHEIAADGYATTALAGAVLASGSLQVPAHSVTILVAPDDRAANAAGKKLGARSPL